MLVRFDLNENMSP